MVDAAERPDRDERMIVREKSGNGVDLGDFEHLIEGHGRLDAGERFREHCLAATRRARHENIVSSRRRNKQGALRMSLSDNGNEIWIPGQLGSSGERIVVRPHGIRIDRTGEDTYGLPQSSDGNNGNVGDH